MSVREGAEKCLFKPLFSAIAGISVAKIAIQFPSGGQRSPFLKIGIGTPGYWGIFHHFALIRTA
jgi:hypothetical protein